MLCVEKSFYCIDAPFMTAFYNFRALTHISFFMWPCVARLGAFFKLCHVCYLTDVSDGPCLLLCSPCWGKRELFALLVCNMLAICRNFLSFLLMSLVTWSCEF